MTLESASGVYLAAKGLTQELCKRAEYGHSKINIMSTLYRPATFKSSRPWRYAS